MLFWFKWGCRTEAPIHKKMRDTKTEKGKEKDWNKDRDREKMGYIERQKVNNPENGEWEKKIKSLIKTASKQRT